MSDRISSWYLWLYGLASVFIRGSSHVGMVILTGTGVAQMPATSTRPRHVGARNR